MSRYRHLVAGGASVDFGDLRTLLAKASPSKAGDRLAGLAAADDVERALARHVLAEVPLADLLEHPVIPDEHDDVTRLILDTHDADAFAAIRDLTVGGLRDWLLDHATDAAALTAVAPGLTPEMVAATVKLMRNQDLVLVASKCRVVTRYRTTIGLAGRLSTRLQPNHPTDDPIGITGSVLDGLLLGSGDAVIGINLAGDDTGRIIELGSVLADLIARLEIPTQSCVLAHITHQLRALERGAPLDLVFQSVAGTQAANDAFGVTLDLLAEGRAAALDRAPAGAQVMYFETGQGSAHSSGAHHGVDMQTCEARAYAVARAHDPLLVNTVVGFIGPEYLYDGREIIRAGLEDHTTAKLLGLPMGCDVCYTNHAEADQGDLDNLLTLLAVAGCTFVMGVPGGDDVMLGYQSTSFHDALYVRQVLGLRPAPEFESWLVGRGVMVPGAPGRLGRQVDPRLTGALQALMEAT